MKKIVEVHKFKRKILFYFVHIKWLKSVKNYGGKWCRSDIT